VSKFAITSRKRSGTMGSSVARGHRCVGPTSDTVLLDRHRHRTRQSMKRCSIKRKSKACDTRPLRSKPQVSARRRKLLSRSNRINVDAAFEINCSTKFIEEIVFLGFSRGIRAIVVDFLLFGGRFSILDDSVLHGPCTGPMGISPSATDEQMPVATTRH
jgi:hypothetical protein